MSAPKQRDAGPASLTRGTAPISRIGTKALCRALLLSRKFCDFKSYDFINLVRVIELRWFSKLALFNRFLVTLDAEVIHDVPSDLRLSIKPIGDLLDIDIVVHIFPLHRIFTRQRRFLFDR